MVNLSWQTLSFGADFFGMIAFLLTLVGSFRCDFLKFTSVDGSFTDHFGVWSFAQWAFISNGQEVYVYEGCFHYSDSVVIDSKWMAARVFSAIVLFGGTLFFMLNAYSACVGYDKRVEHSQACFGVCQLLLSLFAGLTLLILDSNLCKNNVLLGELLNKILFNDQCELSTGANCFISATVFWFMAALCSLSASRSKKEEADEAGEGLDEPLIHGP
mmetsp:Transcript_4669/g.6826  ORF Transcript_4669/g.6826 Transcript_4669/m.6826 type:complete len:215 (-) Transcript_4669:217-861(-)